MQNPKCCDLCKFPLIGLFTLDAHVFVKDGRGIRALRKCEICSEFVKTATRIRAGQCNHKWQITPGGLLERVHETCIYCGLEQNRPIPPTYKGHSND